MAAGQQHPSRPDRSETIVRRRNSTFVVRGRVVGGDQRGRSLGFPTANLPLAGHDPLPDGVWTGFVHLPDGTSRFAATSIGTRPTYYDTRGVRLLEAHILDFSGDLYGRELVIHIHHRLRPQRKYSGSNELIRQLHLDIEQTREWCEEHLTLQKRLLDESRRQLGWGPTQRKTNHRDRAATRTLRAQRRSSKVSQAVRDLLDAGELSLDHVAERTGLPIDYLAWEYPDDDALQRAATDRSPATTRTGSS